MRNFAIKRVASGPAQDVPKAIQVYVIVYGQFVMPLNKKNI